MMMNYGSDTRRLSSIRAAWSLRTPGPQAPQSYKLGPNENDWAIDCRRARSEHFGLERGCAIAYRGPIGVIVHGHQPQRGIPGIAGQRERDVMSLLRVGLGAETGSRPAVRCARIDVEGHVNRRQRDVGSGRRQRGLVEAEKFRHLASIPCALQLRAFTLQARARGRLVGYHRHVSQRSGLFRLVACV